MFAKLWIRLYTDIQRISCFENSQEYVKTRGHFWFILEGFANFLGVVNANVIVNEDEKKATLC